MKINTLDKITAAKVTALLSAAVVTASSMSGVTAYAEELPDAYNAAELAEEVLAPTVADPTKFDFFGTWIIDHDTEGNPDPQIVSNGDGTYTIIIYEGQSVAFPVNNPYANLEAGLWSYPTVITETDLLNDGTWKGNGYSSELITEENGSTYLVMHGAKAGSAVIEVGLEDAYIMSPTVNQIIGNTVTVGLFVLPVTPGAQAPTLTQEEIESEAAYNSNHGAHIPGSTFYFGVDF